MSEENFERAWKCLTDYYENKRRLITSHPSEFFSVTPMMVDTFSELKRLYKETFNPLESLDSLNRANSKYDDLVIFLTSSRFDSLTRREWQWHLCSASAPPSLAQLKDFAQAQILTLESIEGGAKPINIFHHNTSKFKAEQVSVHSTRTVQKGFTRKSKAPSCAFCKGDHFTFDNNATTTDGASDRAKGAHSLPNREFDRTRVFEKPHLAT